MKSKLLTIGVLVVLGSSQMAWSATPAEVKAAITAKFTLTKRSMMSGKVTTPGTVAVIQKAGINADPQTAMAMKAVAIKDGAIVGAGGGAIMGGDSGRSMKAGEQVYLYDVSASAKVVSVMYGTVNSYDVTVKGTTNQQYFKGVLNFKYDDGIAALDVSKVMADVEIWIKTQAESVNSTANTVALGQTPEQVAAILGEPERKVDLGAKKMFFYKDMKVTFVDGKVADVE